MSSPDRPVESGGMRTGRIALLALVGLVAAGCSDLPSKSEFVDRYATKAGAEQISALTSSGITKAAATKIVRDNASCVYEGIRGNEDLLRQAFDEGGDSAVEAEIRAKTASCQAKLADALREATRRK